MPRPIDASLFAVYSFKTPDGYDDDSYTAGVVRVLEDMDESPTLDYKALVPQGEWVNNADDYPECNRCGYMPVYDPAIDDIAYSNFCHNCGARMKGAD